ncbi:MAG: type II toxin-antitoxin system RelE/ParE family toxin [Acidobacteriaceae bacterium]
MEVEVSDEFKEWYQALLEVEQNSVIVSVTLLEEHGPSLGRPHVDTIRGSEYPNMKELRVQHEGRPYRILFAFDPIRNAYLILGGDKTGDNRWYVEAIRRADAIYRKHPEEIGE